MWDKENAITCLSISIVGWLVLIGGAIYNEYAPVENDFSSLINFSIQYICVITALLLQLTKCIVGVVLLVQRNEHKETCIGALCLSLIALLFCAAFLI